MTTYLHRNGDIFTVSDEGRETCLSPAFADLLLAHLTKLAADPAEGRTMRLRWAALRASLADAMAERDQPRPENPEDALWSARELETV